MTFNCPLQRAPFVNLALVVALSATPELKAQVNPTALADAPVLSSAPVPGNLALALSVEFPTALVAAHPGNSSAYTPATEYIGYFDPNKCYRYDSTGQYFQPDGPVATPNATRTCVGKWSGNFLNFATMQTIDPFRWALTGGYRAQGFDTETITVLQRAWSSNQGSNNHPDRGIPPAYIAGATPFTTGTSLLISNFGRGHHFRIIAGPSANSLASMIGGTPAALPATAPVNGVLYQALARVRVCDPSPTTDNLEANCTRYTSGNYKPTGLIQRYANQMRYAAFGYLNDGALARDGGVLRAQMKYVGPTRPVPGNQPAASLNPEWNAANGIISVNPNPDDVTNSALTYSVPATSISNSGVINYLNKFGQLSPNTYKTFDPVGEMYYAALRYFRKLDNVAEWSSIPANTSQAAKIGLLDNFPVITNWFANGHESIEYSCQRNFILGIGDANTHADRNLPKSTLRTSEPAMPAAVNADTLTKDVMVSTKAVGDMHGIGNLNVLIPTWSSNNNPGFLMAGLAYDANTTDIRPAASLFPMPGVQTVQTYWLDVLEGGFKVNNQYYLATKYGGFDVPSNFTDPFSRTVDIPESTWWTAANGNIPTTTIKRPNTYFTAGSAKQMVDGLSRLFSNIVAASTVLSTSASTSFPQISSGPNNASYASSYSADKWTGEVEASTFELGPVPDPNNPSGPQIEGITIVSKWKFTDRLGVLAAGTGWTSTGGRRIVTFNGVGVPFKSGTGGISTTQLAGLDTSYVAGNDSTQFLDYLRGDRSREVGLASPATNGVYRSRANLVGDIVNSRALPIGPPQAPLSDTNNPGYSAFKTLHTSRPTMVLAGTNQGMMHVIHGGLVPDNNAGGRELFAYIPAASFKGPTNTPAVNGLQALGKQPFTHYNFVDAEPGVMDVDVDRIRPNPSANFGTTPNWKTLAIGGLGKGGRALYALDITTVPATNESEDTVATRVRWEIDNTNPSYPDLGFTYTPPAIFKTKRHGWVALVGSGHNPTSGKGVFYFINPWTGAKLDEAFTGVGTPESPAGLSAVMAFIPDPADGTADMIYAGDLQGNLWRLDMTNENVVPAPVRLAVLKDASGAALPVTARPYVVIEPETLRRWVTVGTGRLLDETDKGSTQSQRFYAILDGYTVKAADEIDVALTRPFPILSSDLRQITNLQADNSLNRATEIGWFIDLGTSSAGPAWRVVSDSTSFNGTVDFAAISPSSTDPCSQGGISRIYSVDLALGRSTLKNFASFVPVPGIVNRINSLSVGGVSKTVLDRADGPPTPLEKEPLAALKLRRLNWREVPEGQ